MKICFYCMYGLSIVPFEYLSKLLEMYCLRIG